jgi:selenocysteine-specific elongation factor
METIGGGVIVDTNPRKHKRFDKNVIEALAVKEKGELTDILEEYIKANSKNYPNIKDIMSYSGENEANIKEALNKLIEENKIVAVNNMYMHIIQYDKLKEVLLKTLQDYHKKFRLRKGMVKEETRSKIESKFKTREFDILLDMFKNEDIIKVEDNMVSLAQFNVVFNEKQLQIKKLIENNLDKCGLDTILTVEEVLAGKREYEEVLEALIGNTVEKLDDTYVMSKKIYEQAKDILLKYLDENKEITLGEYRDLVDSSRKNCMIILENFDRNKVTKRIENKRVRF